jgi:hypothetical protein
MPADEFAAPSEAPLSNATRITIRVFTALVPAMPGLNRALENAWMAAFS